MSQGSQSAIKVGRLVCQESVSNSPPRPIPHQEADHRSVTPEDLKASILPSSPMSGLAQAPWPGMGATEALPLNFGRMNVSVSFMSDNGTIICPGCLNRHTNVSFCRLQSLHVYSRDIF